MFNPCTDQTYKGQSHSCFGYCEDCLYKEAKDTSRKALVKVDSLEERVRKELEPRLAQERRAYDRFVMGIT